MLAGPSYQQQQQPYNQQHQQYQQVAYQTISQPPFPSRSGVFDASTDTIPVQANTASGTQWTGLCVTQAGHDIPSTMVVDDDGQYTRDLSGLYSLGRPSPQGSPSKRPRGFVDRSVNSAPKLRASLTLAIAQRRGETIVGIGAMAKVEMCRCGTGLDALRDNVQTHLTMFVVIPPAVQGETDGQSKRMQF